MVASELENQPRPTLSDAPLCAWTENISSDMIGVREAILHERTDFCEIISVPFFSVTQDFANCTLFLLHLWLSCLEYVPPLSYISN